MRIKVTDVIPSENGTTIVVEGLRKDNRYHAGSAEYIRLEHAEAEFGDVDWRKFSRDVQSMELDTDKNVMVVLRKAVDQWRQSE